jgi:hypothetical protein
MSFANDFKKHHTNRSQYPHIKCDLLSESFSVYIFNKPPKVFKSLAEAKKWHDENKGN